MYMFRVQIFFPSVSSTNFYKDNNAKQKQTLEIFMNFKEERHYTAVVTCRYSQQMIHVNERCEI
jgi:hypothetical protein